MNGKQDHEIAPSSEQPTVERFRDEAIRIAIMMLARPERDRRISTVVLAGTYAGDNELARFLRTSFPVVRIESEA